MAVGLAHALEETPHQPTIHRDGRSVDVTGALRCQKCDYGGKLLGRSDAAIILWRRILARELRLIAEGRQPKRWSVPPADIVPVVGI